MTEKQEPRKLESPEHREMARAARNHDWEIADRIAARGTMWFCWWNKNRRHREPYPDDLLVCGLIDGMEILGWLQSHPDWWEIGKWDDTRYAAPVTITAAGRAALAERDKYDMEPVLGGLVEPGWQAIPLPRTP